MSTDAILREFAAKKLDEPLHNISIKHADQVTEAANGRLTVASNGSPRLEIFLAAQPPNQGSSLQPGSIIPANAYATMTADTQRGMKLTANRLFPEHTGWNMPGFNRMVFLPNEVHLVSQAIPSEKASLEGIVAAFPEDVFNADYFVEEDCEMFYRKSHHSWLKLEFEQARLGLRKDESKTCWLKLWSKSPGDPGLEKIGGGFLWALSFLLGRRLHWRAFSHSIGNEDRITLRRKVSSTKKGFPPLPDVHTRELMDKQSELLRQATLFFEDPANDPVLTALQVCWDAADNIFVTRGLLLCAALEGLAAYLVKKSSPSATLVQEEEAFSKLKKRALQVLTSDDELSKDPSLKRITEGISSFGYFTARDKIRRAGELLGVQIGQVEVGDWKDLRNDPAHGDFDFDFGNHSSTQMACNQTASIANILNKVVLALVGYKGPFRDYGARGFPVRNFPN